MSFLRSTVDRHSSVDLEDIKPLKRSLGSLGFYETPKAGFHEYPDEHLFSGIEKFQKKEGLRVDGVMKPGGPTESTLMKRVNEKKGEVKDNWRELILENAPEHREPTVSDPFDNALGDTLRWISGKLEQASPSEPYKGPFNGGGRWGPIHGGGAGAIYRNKAPSSIPAPTNKPAKPPSRRSKPMS